MDVTAKSLLMTKCDYHAASLGERLLATSQRLKPRARTMAGGLALAGDCGVALSA